MSYMVAAIARNVTPKSIAATGVVATPVVVGLCDPRVNLVGNTFAAMGRASQFCGDVPYQ